MREEIKMQDCKKVRSRLTDEQSRVIYDNRLNFAMTGNQRMIWQMLEQINGVYGLNAGSGGIMEKLTRNAHKKLLIFGAGYNGMFLREFLPEFNWFAFLDNKVETVVREPIVKTQTSALADIRWKPLPIYNPKHYAAENGVENALFVICVPGFNAQRAITNQLMGLGVQEADIFAFTPPNSLIPQYFDAFSPNGNETFVDCGVLDGDTVFDFARWSLGKYRKIFAFEADKDNYEKCKVNLSKLQDVALYNLGVWNCEETLNFNKTATGFSNILENEQKSAAKDDIVEIKTCALDEILKGEEISFIKMDIEGAELKALQGAAKIISAQKPKIAVCVYHKPEDMWEIPNLLLELNPSYHFKLRHYGPSAYETVLYAYTPHPPPPTPLPPKPQKNNPHPNPL
jgi:FkbM family methyltransferase